ncbi:MAG: bifunctional diguanylate cyclase/phosphodiesterase [Anaerolineaceae bacterium]|nr:bifunctional diguanylate cyclase/phosphodiesterase [Anaerolineaceae bacterium]
MLTTLNARLSKFKDEYLKFLLLSFLLLFRSILTIIFNFRTDQFVPMLLEAVGCAFVVSIPVLLIIEKRSWISTSILLAMIFIIISSTMATPFIPIEFFLLFPIYRLSRPKLNNKYFVGFSILLGFLLVIFQSNLFFPINPIMIIPIINYRWLVSFLVIGTVITIYYDVPKILRQSNHIENLFSTVEEYSMVINAVDIALWTWDIFDNAFKITRQGADLLGIHTHQSDTILSFHGYAPVITTLHSGDKKILRDALYDISTGKNEYFEHIVRTMIDRDTQLWLKIKAYRQDDVSGQPVRINGSIIDITQHIQYERQSQFFESFDPLTNLPNKKSICQQINGLIEDNPIKEDIHFAVLILNIDRFNAINESLGRAIGDDLLKTFAQRLEKCMRMVDGVAKLSEDTFIVLISRVNSIQNIFIIAERIQERLHTPFWIQRNEIYITASVGIALYHPEIESADDIIQEAEIAMFNAKTMGKGKQVIYDEGMREKVTRRHHIERDLRKAIENNEFELYFQPILSVRHRVITGVEALIRWHHPIRGLVLPAEFIPIAEDTGLIIPIGEWVLESACYQLSEIRKKYPQSSLLTMSVNISAAQLTTDLVDKIRMLLNTNNLSGSSLILEITESVVMNQSEMVSKLIEELRALKVRLHIDDFGTGYSSFKYLQDFPVDSIKIDRSFISQLESNHNNFEIVRTVVSLAHELGMTTIAEGVETQSQLKQLEQFGCESIQGYFISKPVPVLQLMEMLNYASFAKYKLEVSTLS